MIPNSIPIAFPMFSRNYGTKMSNNTIIAKITISIIIITDHFVLYIIYLYIIF